MWGDKVECHFIAFALYVKNNMNAYFEIMLEQCETEIDDSEEVVEFVLNDDSLDEGHKILYNDKITTKISSFLYRW